MNTQVLDKAEVKIDNEGISFSVPRVNGEENLPVRINFGSSAIFIGANGSGKTRLSVFLESHFPQENILRLVAQRSIAWPKHVEVMREADALIKRDYTSFANISYIPHRRQFGRYHDEPAVFPVSDFDILLQILFAEDGNVSRDFWENCREAEKRGENKPNTSESKLEQVIEIWQKILPHRALKYKDWLLKTHSSKDEKNEYSSSEMSDGEREIFYLIGQCITARPHSLIIVDEPELHLNPAIVSSLWTEIEKARPDCAFLYITHDFNFSLSRLNTQKFALTSYQNTPSEKWEIEKIPDETGLPEELLFQLVGSRKKILLVEGKKGSWDNLIYSAVYPEWHVIGVGSCENVKDYMRAFKNDPIKKLHHCECKGIIDKDSRSDKEVQTLQEKGIKVLDFTEIENIFLCENVFKQLLKIFGENPEEKFNELKIFLFDEVEEQKKQLADNFAKQEIMNQVQEVFNEKNSSSWQEKLGKIAIETIIKKHLQEIEKILEDKDYERLSKICNLEPNGLFSQIISKFILKDKPEKFKEKLQYYLSCQEQEFEVLQKKMLESFRVNLPTLE